MPGLAGASGQGLHLSLNVTGDGRLPQADRHVDLGADAEIVEVEARFDREAEAGHEPPVVVRLVIVHVDAVAVDLLAEAVSRAVEDVRAEASADQHLPRRRVDLEAADGAPGGDTVLDECDRGVARPGGSRPRRLDAVGHPGARDAAIAFVQDGIAAGRTVRGFEVDAAARQVLIGAGYGAHVLHRTGHSLGQEIHGNGVHMDDYETHDDRRLVPGLGFTIEPGLYFEDFGIRTEIDMTVGLQEATVTGDIQREMETLA